jgi:hypothetical protein
MESGRGSQTAPRDGCVYVVYLDADEPPILGQCSKPGGSCPGEWITPSTLSGSSLLNCFNASPSCSVHSLFFMCSTMLHAVGRLYMWPDLRKSRWALA